MASEETRSKLELEQGTAQYWHIELNNADKTEEDWRKSGYYFGYGHGNIG